MEKFRKKLLTENLKTPRDWSHIVFWRQELEYYCINPTVDGRRIRLDISIIGYEITILK